MTVESQCAGLKTKSLTNLAGFTVSSETTLDGLTLDSYTASRFTALGQPDYASNKVQFATSSNYVAGRFR